MMTESKDNIEDPRQSLGKWLTACLSSRTLAQYSTDRYAGGLHFRVREGTGCFPAALAVIPKHGISANYLMISVESI